jgi:hypothetical protein
MEVWVYLQCWKLGPDSRQRAPEYLSGPGLILATGEGFSTKSTCYHPPFPRYTGRELPTLVNLSLAQGILTVCQGHSWQLTHKLAQSIHTHPNEIIHTQAYNRGWIFVQVRVVLFPEPHRSIYCRQQQKDPETMLGRGIWSCWLWGWDFPLWVTHAASNSFCPHQEVTTLGENEGGMWNSNVRHLSWVIISGW